MKKLFLLLLFIPLVSFGQDVYISAEDYFNKAQVHFTLKKYSNAIKELDKSLELDPNYKAALYQRGWLKANLNDHNGALKDFGYLIEIGQIAISAGLSAPHMPDIYYQRGLSKANLKDHNGAISDFDKAIELNPKFTNAYISRGNNNNVLKNYSDGISDYNKALKLDPNNALAYKNKGIAERELKNLSDKEVLLKNNIVNVEMPKWIELNEKSVIPYLENQGYEVSIETVIDNGKKVDGSGVVKGKKQKQVGKTGYSILDETFYFLYGSIEMRSFSVYTYMENEIPPLSNYEEGSLECLMFEGYFNKLKESFNVDKNNLREYFKKIDKNKFIEITKNTFETDFYLDVSGFKTKNKAYYNLDCKKAEFFRQEIVKMSNNKFELAGDINLNEIDNFDISLMVKAFIEDLKFYLNNNSINNTDFLESNQIKATFETLEGSTVALSYGYNIDNKIIIKIDPKKWAESSSPKRWYVLYHELGHDVLNLDHGEGGKMMFNFVDRDYSYSEFFKDKEYMFESYLKNYSN